MNTVLLATSVNVKKYEEENDFYSLSSNFEVTDLIMNRFKVYREIEG